MDFCTITFAVALITPIHFIVLFWRPFSHLSCLTLHFLLLFSCLPFWLPFWVPPGPRLAAPSSVQYLRPCVPLCPCLWALAGASSRHLLVCVCLLVWTVLLCFHQFLFILQCWFSTTSKACSLFQVKTQLNVSSSSPLVTSPLKALGLFFVINPVANVDLTWGKDQFKKKTKQKKDTGSGFICSLI